jgi:cysteinyl-tRNA synthetase
MLQTHYRQPLNWTTNSLREAQRVLDHWYELTGDVAPKMFCADVLDALTDDLNTPKVVASLHELRAEAAKGSVPAASSLKASAQLVGLLENTAAEWSRLRIASVNIDQDKVTALIAARNAARQVKNFRESDRIRDELAKMGVVVKDTRDGTTWEIAR